MPHGAPAKKLRRNVRELTTSRPPPEKLSVRTDRVRDRTKQECEKWTLTSVLTEHATLRVMSGNVCGLCSLIPTKNSLFFEIVSLLICVGNCARSHCGAAVSSHEIGSRSLKIARFPVKFPVSREFAWRRERSALRRQPGIPRFREFPSLDVKGPLNAGFSHR